MIALTHRSNGSIAWVNPDHIIRTWDVSLGFCCVKLTDGFRVDCVESATMIQLAIEGRLVCALLRVELEWFGD